MLPKCFYAATVWDTMSIVVLNATIKNVFLIPVNLDFVHLVEKWQQTDG